METRARTQTDMSIASPQFNLYSRVLQTERRPTFHTLPQIQEMPRERPTTNLSTLSHVTWPDWDAGMQVAKCFACASIRESDVRSERSSSTVSSARMTRQSCVTSAGS